MMATCFSASFRTTPVPSKLPMTRSPLIVSLRGPSSDESHPARRVWIELSTLPARLCSPGSLRRRSEVSELADADAFAAAGVVLRLVAIMTASLGKPVLVVIFLGSGGRRSVLPHLSSVDRSSLTSDKHKPSLFRAM